MLWVISRRARAALARQPSRSDLNRHTSPMRHRRSHAAPADRERDTAHGRTRRLHRCLEPGDVRAAMCRRLRSPSRRVHHGAERGEVVRTAPHAGHHSRPRRHPPWSSPPAECRRPISPDHGCPQRRPRAPLGRHHRGFASAAGVRPRRRPAAPRSALGNRAADRVGLCHRRRPRRHRAAPRPPGSSRVGCLRPHAGAARQPPGRRLACRGHARRRCSSGVVCQSSDRARCSRFRTADQRGSISPCRASSGGSSSTSILSTAAWKVMHETLVEFGICTVPGGRSSKSLSATWRTSKLSPMNWLRSTGSESRPGLPDRSVGPRFSRGSALGWRQTLGWDPGVVRRSGGRRLRRSRRGRTATRPMAAPHSTTWPAGVLGELCSEPEMPLLSFGSYCTAATMKKMPETANTTERAA